MTTPIAYREDAFWQLIAEQTTDDIVDWAADMDEEWIDGCTRSGDFIVVTDLGAAVRFVTAAYAEYLACC